MPCSDGGCDAEDRRETQDRLDKVTRLLCSLLETVDKNGNGDLILDAGNSFELADWWKEHQEKDRKRIAEERREEARIRKKKNALKKLTQEERNLLNL